MGQVVHISSFFITETAESWSHSKIGSKCTEMMVIFALEVWNIFLWSIYETKREIGKTARIFSCFVQILRLVLQIEENVMPSNIFRNGILTGMQK